MRSYMITSSSFPSDLGSGAAALSMWLCGAKPALRIHKLLRTAGARNSSLLRRKHYRDNDRAATVRHEREIDVQKRQVDLADSEIGPAC